MVTDGRVAWKDADTDFLIILALDLTYVHIFSWLPFVVLSFVVKENNFK